MLFEWSLVARGEGQYACDPTTHWQIHAHIHRNTRGEQGVPLESEKEWKGGESLAEERKNVAVVKFGGDGRLLPNRNFGMTSIDTIGIVTPSIPTSVLQQVLGPYIDMNYIFQSICVRNMARAFVHRQAGFNLG